MRDRHRPAAVRNISVSVSRCDDYEVNASVGVTLSLSAKLECVGSEPLRLGREVATARLLFVILIGKNLNSYGRVRTIITSYDRQPYVYELVVGRPHLFVSRPQCHYRPLRAFVGP